MSPGAAGPLTGRRVLVGRSPERSRSLLAALAGAGAEARAVPFIAVRPLADAAELDRLVLDAADGSAEWLVFTSVNAVTALVTRAAALRLSPAVSAATRVAAVGPATAAALHDAGIAVDLRPVGRGSARDLVEVFPTARPGETVLHPRSELADGTLPDGLARKGFTVRCADAYRTDPVALPDDVAADLRAGRYDAVVVSSASGVPALLAAQPAPGTAVVAIGASTAAEVVRAGLAAPTTASTPTDTAVVTAVVTAVDPAAAPATAPATAPVAVPATATDPAAAAAPAPDRGDPR